MRVQCSYPAWGQKYDYVHEHCNGCTRVNVLLVAICMRINFVNKSRHTSDVRYRDFLYDDIKHIYITI